MPKTTIEKDICKGCKLCIKACPKQIIVLEKDSFNAKGFYPAGVAAPEKCTGCAACAIMCPECAIKVER